MSKRSVSLDMLLVEPAALVMIGAELCEIISPASVPILALTGLLFPFALLIFSIGVILRISRGFMKGMILPAVILFLSFSSITNTVGWMGRIYRVV